jgi:hypothetical protein
LTKLPYHSGTEGVVKVDPTSAAPKQAATNASNARAERAGPWTWLASVDISPSRSVLFSQFNLLVLGGAQVS